METKGLFAPNKLSTQYQKLSDIEHVLKAPDTYIGSTDKDKTTNWILNSKGTMEHKEYTWIPGLYKCFDEGLVNARDHHIRMTTLGDVGDDGEDNGMVTVTMKMAMRWRWRWWR